MERVGDNSASPELRKRIVEILRDGGQVVLPTETVYGIAARADLESAREGVAELKGRPAEMPLTWHVGSLDALERFERVSPMALRLAERYWPGPLTLVLPGVPRGLEYVARDGWTGVRFPAHEATRDVLAACDFPVVMTSVNQHGSPPALDAEAAERVVANRSVLVVDGGACKMAESSTVLRVGPGHFDILRQGPLDLQALQRCAGLALAFVCTGNTCRSPMAQALAAQRIAARLEIPIERLREFGFSVRSMGAYAGPGMPASEFSVEAMRREGLDLSMHASTPLDERSSKGLDRIYGLTHSHVEAARSQAPELHVELLDPEGSDVPDPIGGSLEDYLACSERIGELIERRLDEWV
jgi:tRNA threonylcarbamoyl adenosine modification protein (Sua5/YciO/YrdC/YwlC family)